MTRLAFLLVLSGMVACGDDDAGDSGAGDAGDSLDGGPAEEAPDAEGAPVGDAASPSDGADAALVCGGDSPCQVFCSDIEDCLGEAARGDTPVSGAIALGFRVFGFSTEEPGECGGCLEQCEALERTDTDDEVQACFAERNAELACDGRDLTTPSNRNEACCDGQFDSALCSLYCRAARSAGWPSPTCETWPNQPRAPSCEGECPGSTGFGLPIDGDGPWELTAAAVDAGGRIAVTVAFEGEIDLGGGTLESLGGSSEALAVYEPDGTFAFDHLLGGMQDTVWLRWHHQLAFDPDGNIAVLTDLLGSADLGDGGLTARGTVDAALVSFTPDGDVRFVHVFTGEGEVRARTLWAGADHTLVSGVYDGDFEADGTTVTSAGNTDIFVARIDAAGELVWIRTHGGSDTDAVFSLMGLPDGDHIALGAHSDGLDLGDGALTVEGGEGEGDGFTARYSDAGELRWSRILSHESNQLCYAITADTAGADSTFVTQCYTGAGPYEYGGKTYPDAGQITSRLDQDGELLTYEGTPLQRPFIRNGLAAHPHGGVALTGTLGMSTDLGGGELLVVASDIAIARHDAGGAHLWSMSLGGLPLERPATASYQADGTLTVVGTMTDVLDHGDGVIEREGSGVFVLQLAD